MVKFSLRFALALVVVSAFFEPLASPASAQSTTNTPTSTPVNPPDTNGFVLGPTNWGTTTYAYDNTAITYILPPNQGIDIYCGNGTGNSALAIFRDGVEVVSLRSCRGDFPPTWLFYSNQTTSNQTWVFRYGSTNGWQYNTGTFWVRVRQWFNAPEPSYPYAFDWSSPSVFWGPGVYNDDYNYQQDFSWNSSFGTITINYQGCSSQAGIQIISSDGTSYLRSIPGTGSTYIDNPSTGIYRARFYSGGSYGTVATCSRVYATFASPATVTPTASPTLTASPTVLPTDTLTPTVDWRSACEDYTIGSTASGSLYGGDYLSSVSGTLSTSYMGQVISIPAWPAQIAWGPRPSGTFSFNGPGVLRVCTIRVGAIGTPTATRTATTTATPFGPTATATSTRTSTPTGSPLPTSTATGTATSTITPEPTETDIPSPTTPPECVGTPTGGLTCQQIWLQQTQIAVARTSQALQRTQVALQRTAVSGGSASGSWGTPQPGGTAGPVTFPTVQAALGNKEPFGSLSGIGGAIAGAFNGLAQMSTPSCSVVNVGTSGSGWIVVDMSYFAQGFCWMLDKLSMVVTVVYALGFALVGLMLWNYYRDLARRLGDV